MVVVSYSGKEINAKLVYYGPGLSGKTTNLEHIYKSVPQSSRGKMVSMKTRSERTLFFDFLPIDLGQLGGFKTRFLLYTVPGQVYYNATRKLVLRGVDAVVFVADSERGKMKENIESLKNLRDNLKDYDLDLDEMPWVIQYNKRDMEDLYSIEELELELNPQGVPHYEAVAMTGEGVFECFQGVGKVLLAKLSKEIKLEERASAKIARAKRPVAPPAAAAGASKPELVQGSGAGSRPAKLSDSKTPQETAAGQKSAPVPEDVTSGVKGTESPAVETPVAEKAKVLAGPGSTQDSFQAPQQTPATGGNHLSAVAVPVVDEPGFWGRLVGKKSRSRLVVMASPEAPTTGEVRTISVPIQIDAKDLKPGTQLRLILNIEVRSAEQAKAA